VVRGRPCRGDESSIRQGKTPIRVNQNPIESSKNRGVLLIRPSKLTIKQRDFKETQIRNTVVEKPSFKSVKIIIRFVPWVTKEVEISENRDGVG
jgi:hypothetical protein